MFIDILCIHSENSSDVWLYLWYKPLPHCMTLYSDFTPPSLCVQINPQLLQGAPCSKGNLIPEYIEGQQSLGLKVKHDFVKEKAGIQIQHTCCLELLSVSSERKDCGKALDGFSSRASRADFNPNLGTLHTLVENKQHGSDGMTTSNWEI